MVGISLMFAWLMFDRSIWALVAGNIFSSLMSTILGHAVLPGVANRLEWDTSAFREIFQFGKWLFLSSVMGFLAMNGDRLILGAMTNAAVLGVYSIALAIVAAIEMVLNRIILQVAFPAISEIVRDRPSEMSEAYYRVHAVVASIAYFCSGALFIAGESLIGVLYDDRYADAGWMLQILAFGLIAVPFQMATSACIALGAPWKSSVTWAFRACMVFVAMPAGFRFFGVGGAIGGLVFSQLLSVPLIVFLSSRSKFLSLRRELIVLPFLVAGVAIGYLCTEALRYLRG
jgi:O-antigen/teichoic acid export membrane protein